MSSEFRYQAFVAASGNLGGEFQVVDDVLSSHEQEIHPTTSLDENCIEFEFQTDQNYYVDLRQTYLALKLKLVRGRGYENYMTKEVKNEHKKEAKAEEEETVEEETPVPLVTYVNNNLHSIFSNVEVYINNNKFTTPIDCMLTNLKFSTTSREPFLNTKEFCTAKGTILKNFLMKLWKRLCLNLFSQGEWKCLAHLMASCCMVNWGLTFSPMLNCYIQIWKLG